METIAKIWTAILVAGLILAMIFNDDVRAGLIKFFAFMGIGLGSIALMWFTIYAIATTGMSLCDIWDKKSWRNK